MEDVDRVHEFCRRKGVGEVQVCDMESAPLVLRGVNGKRYAEVDGNVWMALEGDEGIAYVGTSRHGGHMTLRPLFVKVEGAWRNALTGRVSDFTRWERAC